MRNLARNPLFRLLDRIPGLRRSGTASRWDLMRAMLVPLVLCFFFQIGDYTSGRTPLWIGALVLFVCIIFMVLAMMLHPFLSNRASLYDTLFPPRRRPQ